MTADFQRPAVNSLQAVLALVAGSSILSTPAPRPDVPFAGWENECKSADADALLLAWIAGLSRGPAYRGRLH
jgi:hypothetical protein